MNMGISLTSQVFRPGFFNARSNWRNIAYLALTALLLASCAPLGTRPVVKIGLVAPFEGLYRPLGYDVLNAVKLAVRECNENGGAASYMVQIVALNDSNDPAQAVLQTRKMDIDQDVMGVIGGLSSKTALATLEEYHEAGLAFITLASADAVTECCYPEVFRLFATNSLLGREAARYAVRELGATRLAVLCSKGDLIIAFAEEADRLGTAVVKINALNEDWLTKAKEADLVFFGGGAVEGAELVRRVREAKLDVQLMGGSELGDPKLVQIGGEAAKGVLYITPATQMTDYETSVDQPHDPRAILAYDATWILLKALTQAIERDGRPSREGVGAALADTWYTGLSGAIAFDSCGDWVDPPVHIHRIK